MTRWMPWRGPAIFLALSVMLMVSGLGTLMAAGDANEASDGQATASVLARAAADLELAWFQAMGADALAATGEAPLQSQGIYDGAINLYNQAKAVLAAAGVEQIDMALAGSDQGLQAMGQAFQQTLQLAETEGPAAATQHHLDITVVQIYNDVDPAVQGLKVVAGIADSRLQSSLDSGASTLRWFSVFTLIFAAAGLAWTAYSGWNVYRGERIAAAAEQPEQVRKAA